MTSDPDEALRWDGDDAVLPPGWRAVGRGSENVAQQEPGNDVNHPEAQRPGVSRKRPADFGAEEPIAAETEESNAQPLGTAMLLLLGVLGGVYLLYTIGWLVGGFRLQVAALILSPSLTSVMYLVALWTAVLSPALWFTASLVLTRGSRTWIRVAALAAGVVLLVPWPFVLLGAWGS